MSKPKITEIIPDNMPEWMEQAMDDGQLFNRVISKVEELEHRLTHYQRAVEEIDDWFKYAMDAKADQRKVHQVLEKLTEALKNE